MSSHRTDSVTSAESQIGRIARLPRWPEPDLVRAGLVGIAVAGVLVAIGGRVSGALALGFSCALATAALTRPFPVYAALVFLCLVASAELGELPIWTDEKGFNFFTNAWRLLSPPGQRYFGFLLPDSFEIVLLGIVAGRAIGIARGRERLAAVADLWPVGLFGAGVVGMFAYGLATDGTLKPALWQVRPFLHLVALTALTPQVVRTRAEVRTTIWVVVIAACTKAIEALWMFVFYRGGHFGAWRELVSHEASIYFVSVISLAA